MSFEHPNRNNESIRDVERDIMRRPPEHNPRIWIWTG